MAPDAEIDTLVEAAVAHHRAGRIAEAERLYVDALAADPGHWRALHNLGVLCLDRGQAFRAAEFLKQAMAHEARGAPTWIAYGRALINTRAFAEAEQLIADHAGEPQAELLETRLRQAWGAALLQTGAPAAAEVQFRRALELAPEDAQARGDLGHALLAKGEVEAAVEQLETAAGMAAEDVAIRLNLGSALYKLRRLPEAEACYRRALALEPGHPAAIRNLGLLLNDEGRAEEALALAASAPPAAAAMAESIRAEALLGRARYEEALAALDNMVALTPDDTSARYRRAFVRLLLCDFAGGWEDYETRWDEESFRDGSALITNLPIVHLFDRRLKPEDLAGRRVLLVAEQGIGDHVMFASIVPDLARVAGEVTFVCESRLARLFSNAFPQVRAVGAADAEVRLSDFDHVVPLASLGRLWRNRLGDFPGTAYLRPREAVRRRWAEALGPKTRRLRIGLSWRGGTRRTGGASRSLELAQLAPILDLPDCEFVSLQYGDVAEELAAFNAGRTAPIRFFPKAEIDDFEELAGLVESLDLVVSVQTAVVHLSGALGKTCLTLIPFRPEWRYTARAERPPWYRSVQLFRQPERGDWGTPIGRIAEELAAWRG